MLYSSILGYVHAFAAHAHVCAHCTCSHVHAYLHTLTCTHLACTLLLCTRLHCTCFFARAFSFSPFAFSCYAFASRIFASRCAFASRVFASRAFASRCAFPSFSSTGLGAAAAASLSTRSERRRAAWFRDHVAGSMRVTLRVTTLSLRAGSSWGGTNPPSPPPTSPRVPLRLLSLQARPVGGAIAS